MNNHFQYKLDKDAGVTGRFEVVMHKKADFSDEGTVIHSKKNTGRFPSENWQAFDEAIQN